MLSEEFNLTFDSRNIQTRVFASFRAVTSSNRDEISTETAWGVRNYRAINHGALARPTGDAWVHVGWNGTQLTNAVRNIINTNYPGNIGWDVTRFAPTVEITHGRHTGTVTNDRTYQIWARGNLTTSSPMAVIWQQAHRNTATTIRPSFEYDINSGFNQDTVIEDDGLGIGIRSQIPSGSLVGNEIRMYPDRAASVINVRGLVYFPLPFVSKIYNNNVLVGKDKLKVDGSNVKNVFVDNIKVYGE